jgi:amidophosphoribosyltransferase
MEMLNERGMWETVYQVYYKCKEDQGKPKEQIVNHVKEIYAPFSVEEISRQIARMMHSEEIKADIRIVYQTVDNLHKACPNDLGDWYFTGDYPTPGGNKVANQSFINYYEGKNQRSY